MSRIDEIQPERLHVSDVAGIQRHLRAHGYACVRGALSAQELSQAHDLLWQHLEGTEEATRRMSQTRPIGWKRGKPTSWIKGHGDALMTSTTHCASMWYVRSRPGVMKAFHAAYNTSNDRELVAMYDRMSINLPTSSGNPEALRVAARGTSLGKFGVAQQMHHHAGHFYGEQHTAPEYYSIVPLHDMNRRTGATAIVPDSHLKVTEISELRIKKWGADRQRPEWTEERRMQFAADIEPFTAYGLAPVVTNIKAGDCVLFDTRLFHGGYSAEDPSGQTGREMGNLRSNSLLRAIYILGASPAALQTPEILQARRRAYELDIFWPPPLDHHKFAAKLLRGSGLQDLYTTTRTESARAGENPQLEPEGLHIVRRFEDAPDNVKSLVDPSWGAVGGPPIHPATIHSKL